jgi:folate-dependent phosphoribosylglycinamide formyltransferase PurN
MVAQAIQDARGRGYMNNRRGQPYVIGILGMPDNENTPHLIRHLAAHDIPIAFVVYWTPSIKDQYRRVVRKVKLAGIVPTLKRVTYALVKAQSGPQEKQAYPYRQYVVPGHNSPQCQQILRNEQVDILLLATDAIITHKILSIPRLVTLNAHPGWIPQFRGLGSTAFQLAQGRFPAVSVHKVDEGVDTGPLVLRECIAVDPRQGLDAIEQRVHVLQRDLMVRAIKMFQAGDVQFIDTFEEPSNMTRGMTAVQRKALDKKLRSGRLKLAPFD